MLIRFAQFLVCVFFLSVPFPKAHQHTASTYRSLFPARQPLPTGVVLLGHLAPQEQCCDLTQRLLRPSPPRTGARFNSKPRPTRVVQACGSPARVPGAPPLLRLRSYQRTLSLCARSSALSCCCFRSPSRPFSSSCLVFYHLFSLCRPLRPPPSSSSFSLIVLLSCLLPPHPS